MSFVLPQHTDTTRRRAQSSTMIAEQQRQNELESRQHEKLKAELQGLVKKQAERIEKLKLESAVQLEHHSTLRRLELERRKAAAEEQISQLTPRLEIVRSQWTHAKEQNQGYEMQWGGMRTQFQAVKARVDTLKQQIEEGRTSAETTRNTINDMRDHIHKLERDKAALRASMKRALECIVIDDNFLKARVAEEEAYHMQLQQALSAMQSEYQETQAKYQHEFAPLEDDARLLAGYLDEMQGRTKELQRYCLELEGKAATIEDHWIEQVHSVFESLERANNMNKLKNIVLTYLEQLIKEHKDMRTAPRTRSGHMDGYWLSNAVAVWEGIAREVTQEKQKMQIREESTQLLAQTSQQTQQAKTALTALKQRVDGTGDRRRQLFQEISDLHYLLLEKKEAEEQMVKYVQDNASQLDEDLSLVLHLIRKDGFDDYVSSTDEDDVVEDSDFGSMREEGNDDIAAIVSSIDLDPDDPDSTDKLKRMAHRPEGPLREFAAMRSQYLQKGKQHQGGVTTLSKQRKPTMDTLERALMDVQVRLHSEVIDFVRNRQQQIQQGLHDPKQEKLQADPKYVNQAREITTRIDQWIQQQKDNPGRPVLQGPKGDGSGAFTAGAVSTARIEVEGARVPAELVRASPTAKISYYLTLGVRGYNFMIIHRRTMKAQLRQVFVSRDLSRIVARRVGGDGTDEDISLRLADITAVKLGHKTEVFKEARTMTKYTMKEEVAFSIVTHLGSSLDIECENADDRTFWAGNFAWIINECRPGGLITGSLKAGKVSVIDSMHRTPTNNEPKDRGVLQIQAIA